MSVVSQASERQAAVIESLASASAGLANGFVNADSAVLGRSQILQELDENPTYEGCDRSSQFDESPEWLSPLGAPRTVHEPLDSHGS
jgi:hypothetical protein